MRILLGLQHVKKAVVRDRRQQVTPEMNFTCEDLITRWVVGGTWSSDGSDSIYPELQIWRRADNDSGVYRKINGTSLAVGARNESGIYEYGDFPPIPFQVGDIVGMFVARDRLSRLRVRSEDTSGLFNYYLTLEDGARESPVEEMDLGPSGSLQSQQYLPLVSVYISHTHSSTYSTTYSSSMSESSLLGE